MKLTLTIPDDQYEKLDATAGKQGAAKYLADRIDQLITIDPKNAPLVLQDKHLAQLQTLAAGAIFPNPDKLVDWLRSTQTLRFPDGCEVELNSDDLYSLHQQAIGMGATSFEDYLREFIQEAVGYTLYGNFSGRR